MNMSYLPIAADLAVRATRNQVNGAHALDPVHSLSQGHAAAEEQRRRHWVRARSATVLRRIAAALEPTDLPVSSG